MERMASVARVPSQASEERLHERANEADAGNRLPIVDHEVVTFAE